VSLYWTQFAVAVIGMLALAAATCIALIGDVFYERPSELTFALVTGLTFATGQATAYLFRLNGGAGARTPPIGGSAHGPATDH